VVNVIREQPRPEGPTLRLIEMSHLRRSTHFGLCRSTA
jgi:hypothetical protein